MVNPDVWDLRAMREWGVRIAVSDPLSFGSWRNFSLSGDGRSNLLGRKMAEKGRKPSWGMLGAARGRAGRDRRKNGGIREGESVAAGWEWDRVV